MARKKRLTSENGLYTVILRTKNLCFKEEKIKHIFFDTLRTCLSKDDSKILCYAVGNKDAYLIVKEGEGGLGNFVKKICVSFVHKYKKLFKSVSSVFYDRYLSEPITTDASLLENIVKIHSLKDKTTPTGEKLNFVTSFENYFGDDIVSSDYVLEKFSRNQFDEAHQHIVENKRYMLVEKLTDKQVADYIYYTYGIKASDMEKISKPLLNEILTSVVGITKASARQIGRVTKISLRYLWGLFKKKDKSEKEIEKKVVKETK